MIYPGTILLIKVSPCLLLALLRIQAQRTAAIRQIWRLPLEPRQLGREEVYVLFFKPHPDIINYSQFDVKSSNQLEPPKSSYEEAAYPRYEA